MEQQTQFSAEGPFAYANWKAMEAGLPSNGASEYPLYTDAHVVSSITDGYGPYQFLNTVPMPLIPGLKPSIVLRMEDYLTYDLPEASAWETDYTRYHGGGLMDEIAALVSLCLGIRLESGPCTRNFEPGHDPKGYPIAWNYNETPTLPPMNKLPVLPQALGQHSLTDISPLQGFPRLTPEDAVALVRAARLYQNAIWIVETQPELSWVMFVSAIEVAAGHWRSAKDPPLDRLRASRPKLVKILLPYGEQLLQQVAKQVANFMGATSKFIDFIINFRPDAPEHRSDPFCQFEWTEENFRESLGKIYEHRCNALHGGIPFPAPMCQAFTYREGGAYPEIPLGMASSERGAIWTREDTPMLLHLFEYIVRNALLKWWNSMETVDQQSDREEGGGA